MNTVFAGKEAEAILSLLTLVMSLLTIIATNANASRINRNNMKLQKEQFEKSMNEQSRQFKLELDNQNISTKQNLKMGNRFNRISIMPYFILCDEKRIINKGEKLEFELEFVNKGNGTSIETYLRSDNLCIFEEKAYKLLYYQQKPLSLWVVEKGEKTSVRIATNKIISSAQKVVFTLEFKDMMMRKYEQRFRFFYEISSDDKIAIQGLNEPICIEDIEYK